MAEQCWRAPAWPHWGAHGRAKAETQQARANPSAERYLVVHEEGPRGAAGHEKDRPFTVRPHSTHRRACSGYTHVCLILHAPFALSHEGAR